MPKDIKDLQPYQQRVVEESNQIDDRTNKLKLFLKTDTFKGLPVAEQKRLYKQLELMQDLGDVLRERIEAW